MGPLVVVVLGLLAIATVRLLADRIGVAAPLLLVLLGVGVALLPGPTWASPAASPSARA